MHPELVRRVRAVVSRRVVVDRVDVVLASVRAVWSLLDYPDRDGEEERARAAWIAAGVIAAERKGEFEPEERTRVKFELIRGGE